MPPRERDGKKDWTQIAYKRVMGQDEPDNEKEAAQISDVLFSLSSSGPACHDDCEESRDESTDSKSKKSKACAKQLQLPMFLSKTYHMIDQCDSEIATWAEDGQSFVVKNTELFATKVLPLYFKHSNFSSFARQLNFYGFRKLRSDPILNSNADPQTASFVRFYHEYFQKDKPELLHQIKRATKTDQQSKDDVEALKQEVTRLRDEFAYTTATLEQKVADVTRDCDLKVARLTADYEKLAAIVQQTIAVQNPALVAAAASLAPTTTNAQASRMPDLLHSLSQAAFSLQPVAAPNANRKRKAEDREDEDSKQSSS